MSDDFIKTNDFEARDKNIELTLRGLGRTIKSLIPQGWTFTLLIQSVGDGGSTFYISSAEREGAIKSLEEFLGKIKKS